jgi:hypothetical protein
MPAGDDAISCVELEHHEPGKSGSGTIEESGTRCKKKNDNSVNPFPFFICDSRAHVLTHKGQYDANLRQQIFCIANLWDASTQLPTHSVLRPAARPFGGPSFSSDHFPYQHCLLN